MLRVQELRLIEIGGAKMTAKSQRLGGWWRVGAAAVALGGALAATWPSPTHAGERSSGGRVTLEIPGVSCAGCSLPIRRALKQAGGVTGVEEGNTKTRLVVSFEPASGRPAVYVEAVRRAGFPNAHSVEGP